jgi:hypothetical protein
MMVAVNPNYTDHALSEINRCVVTVRSGQAGREPPRRRSASRSDRQASAHHGLPILHHIWRSTGAVAVARDL